MIFDEAYTLSDGVNIPKLGFGTGKVAAEHKSYQSAMDSINETLQKMKLDYLDMDAIMKLSFVDAYGEFSVFPVFGGK